MIFSRKGGHLHTGRQGEEFAADFLAARGYLILERNYKKRSGEIDIVARDGDTLVFVEVKTRTNRRFGSGVEAIDWRKQKRLATTALHYLSFHRLHGEPVRFDVVAIGVDSAGKPDFELIKNAMEYSEP